MQPTTYFGIALGVLALVLLAPRRIEWIWRFFALCQIFGATSMATLSALGGSSLVLPQFGVAVLIIAVMFAVAPSDPEATRRTLQRHWTGFALIAYAIVISYFGPRLFAGAIKLVAMRVSESAPFATPLGPSSANITQPAYLTGSLLTAAATSLIFYRRLPEKEFGRSMLAIAAIHALLAVIDAAGLAVGQGRVLDFLRNANYTMHDQMIEGISRLSGALPEPSAYAGFGIPFAVFATEEWLRRRSPAAGLIGLWLWIMLLASTSTTALFGFAVYMLIFVPRLVLAKNSLRRVMYFAVVGTAIVLGFVLFAFAAPRAFSAVTEFVSVLTVGKVDSDSAIERGQWVKQGWEAFFASYGLGVGLGSFRSSSFASAVAGSMGAVGVGLVLAYVGVVVWTAFRPSTPHKAMERSAAWAALMALIQAMSSAASADPGFVFAVFAGFALRPKPARAHVSPPMQERAAIPWPAEASARAGR